MLKLFSVKHFTIISISILFSLIFTSVVPYSHAVSIAETIQGENIAKNTPYGCKTYPISTPQQDNRIHVSLYAYALNTDVNVVIQIDGKTKKNQDLPMQSWTPVSGTFTMSENNSHTLGICLLKTFSGSDTRTLEFNDVKWDTSKVTPPPVVQQSSPVVQQPTVQNTCPEGTTTEIRGVDVVCVTKKIVEKTCPDGTYLGVDNNGNSACRSIQTNQIDTEQNKETVTTPPKIQEPKPIPMLDNDNFIKVAIIGVVIVAVIVIAIVVKKTYRPKIDNNTMYSSSTESYSEKTPANPSRAVPAYSGEENPDFALKQFDFSQGLERVIEVTYNKEKEVDVKLFFSTDKDEWSTFVRNYKEKVKDNFIRLNIEPSKRTNSGLISGGNYEFNDDFDAGYTLRVSMKYSDKKLMAKITSVLRDNNFGCLPSTKFTVDAHRNFEHPTEYEAEKILASITDRIYQKLT